jgi:hypothetical protein
VGWDARITALMNGCGMLSSGTELVPYTTHPPDLKLTTGSHAVVVEQVNFTVTGVELLVHDTPSEAAAVPVAQFLIREAQIHFSRPEDDRKVFDVGLYRCSVRDLRGGGVAGHDGTILSPYGREMEGGGQQAPPQFVFRYGSTPGEPSSTNLVIDYLNIFVLFGPLLYLAKFFTDLGPDPLEPPPASGEEVEVPRLTASDPGAGRPGSPSWPMDLPSEEPSVTGLGEGEDGEVRVEVVQRVKITLHHPRFIFMERREGRGGRAVVVRGLCLCNYVKEVERRRDGLVPRTTWKAEIDKLECYICPDIGGAGFPDHGISLLNPVSASFVYSRSYSALRSPIREVALTTDALTIYLSCLDLETVQHVLESWYRANIGTPTHRRKRSGGVGLPSPSPASGVYDVTFSGEKLGLILKSIEDTAVVDSNSAPPGKAPFPGDRIVSIQGRECGYVEAVQLIRTLGRPLVVTFARQRAGGRPRSVNLSSTYSVVIGVDELIFYRSKLPDGVLLADKAAREGRPTAMLVAINGQRVDRLGYSKTIDLLGRTASPMLLHVRELARPATVDAVQAVVSAISILVIDDYDGRDSPLLKARAHGLTAGLRQVVNRAASWGAQAGRVVASSLTVASRVQVTADYYNGRIGAWEPLLEDMGVVCKVARTKKQSEEEATTTVEVVGEDGVRVNVTDAVLELFLRTLDDWKRGPAEGESPSAAAGNGPSAHLSLRPSVSVSSDHKRGSPYVLRNFLGVPCKFWVVRQETALSGEEGVRSPNKNWVGEVHEASRGVTVPFSVDDYDMKSFTSTAYGSGNMRREYDSVYTLFVRLEGAPPLDAELSSLPLSKVGRHAYSLYATKRHAGVHVVWEVHLEGGRRVLTLRSAIELENNSAHVLEIRKGEEADAEAEMITLPIMETARLPITWVGDPAILIRPQGSQEYGWSEPVFRPPSFRDTDAGDAGADVKDFVTCGPLPGVTSSLRPLVFQLDVQAQRVARPGAEGGGAAVLTIKAHASVTLINLLPAPVRYAWRESGNSLSQAKPEMGVLDPGEERGLQRTHLLAVPAEVCLKVQGFHRSDWVDLTAGAPDSTQMVRLLDDTGNFLVVKVDTSRRGPHAVALTLYVDFWVQNLSGLPLTYGEPLFSEVTETLSGAAFNDVVLSPVQVRPASLDQPVQPQDPICIRLRLKSPAADEPCEVCLVGTLEDPASRLLVRSLRRTARLWRRCSRCRSTTVSTTRRVGAPSTAACFRISRGGPSRPRTGPGAVTPGPSTSPVRSTARRGGSPAGGTTRTPSARGGTSPRAIASTAGAGQGRESPPRRRRPARR